MWQAYSALLRPVLHGAGGPWDEVISLIPVAVGLIVAGYLLYQGWRGRQAGEGEPPEEWSGPGPRENPKA